MKFVKRVVKATPGTDNTKQTAFPRSRGRVNIDGGIREVLREMKSAVSRLQLTSGKKAMVQAQRGRTPQITTLSYRKHSQYDCSSYPGVYNC